MVAATDDSLTLALERLDGQLGLDPPLRRQPGQLASGQQHDEDDRGFSCPSYTQTYRVTAVDAAGNESAAERSADRDDARRT